MDKSPEAFRTISEVAEQLDTPAHVLRFWESRFPQIRPVKRAGGRRYYRPSDVALLTGIKRLLHDDGLTIRGVQKILREQGVRHVAGLGGDDGQRVDAYVDIIDETPVAAELALPQEAADQPLATVGAAPEDRAAAPVLPEPPDLWPDADLTPPEVVTAFDLDLVVAVAPGAAPQEPATDTDDDQFLALLAEVSRTEDQDRVPAPRVPVADAGGTDDPDAPSLPETGKTMPAAPVRADDTWRSIPLAHGEDMPLSSRVRAMPRGALVPRRDEVSAWVVRARDLTRRMGEPARTGRD